MASGRAVERRIVTVLFADLVGFTALSERLDAEDVALVQDAYFDIVRETIGRHGGQLEKFIGDAAMAVFGVPRSRDDDAERAVRSGLALVAAVERLGATIGTEAGALALRVGVNSGETSSARRAPNGARSRAMSSTPPRGSRPRRSRAASSWARRRRSRLPMRSSSFRSSHSR